MKYMETKSVNNTNSLTGIDFKAVLAKLRANQAAIVAAAAAAKLNQEVQINGNVTQYQATNRDTATGTETKSSDEPDRSTFTGTGRTGETIEFNTKQQEFITLGSEGKSTVLIGAAGTGKTTSTQGLMRSLVQNGRAGILKSEGHKYLITPGTPGIVVIAFTRRAIANIKRFAPKDMQNNCITFHKLMEYEPVYYDVIDPETGDMRKTMRFEATRNRYNTLPTSIRTIFIEESSMFSVEYFTELQAACPHNPQYIFLGDIQQLPPIFGAAILGYKMLELPVIELTQVYRQALESPIIRLAHQILSGVPIPGKDYPNWKVEGKLTIHPWKKKLSADNALGTAAKFFTKLMDDGIYNAGEDMILIPFNKAFGTDDLNKHIAQHIARKEKKVVWEIIAGFNKIYLSVGDKVLYDKEDATIVEIKRNPTYTGAAAQEESNTLDYWGYQQANAEQHKNISEDDIDFLLSQAAVAGSDEDRVKKASHIVVVRMNDSLQEVAIDSASALNALILGYALTVHKAQGSEWRKVFFILHQSHAVMIQREMLYTAVTRAKEELYIICEPETFTNGIKSQRIKGNTLAEKAEWFKGKKEELDQKAGILGTGK